MLAFCAVIFVVKQVNFFFNGSMKYFCVATCYFLEFLRMLSLQGALV